MDTNLSAILKVRQLSSALLYHTLLDPVLSKSGDEIRHPPSLLLPFGNFRTRSVASGPASATPRASAASEEAPFWPRAEAKGEGVQKTAVIGSLCCSFNAAAGRSLNLPRGGALLASGARLGTPPAIVLLALMGLQL